MENVLELNNFQILDQDEMEEIDGGVAVATAVAIWGVCVTAGTLVGQIYHKYFCDGGHN